MRLSQAPDSIKRISGNSLRLPQRGITSIPLDNKSGRAKRTRSSSAAVLGGFGRMNFGDLPFATKCTRIVIRTRKAGGTPALIFDAAPG